MEKLPISLVVITLNEERNIARCIQSVPFASEVIVLDSGSTDRTVDIARHLGARVAVETWRGYFKQKVRATAFARNEWVLSLDADEALSPEAAEEVQEIIKSGQIDDFDGYEFPRLSYHLGRWIHHGGWYPDAQLRLFHKQKASWQEGNVHEKVKAGKVKRLKKPIHHWVFKDLADQVDTNNEYSSLGAKDLVEQGKGFSLLKLVLKPVSKFVETYIWKKGFMDGLPGFIISVGAAYSVFLKFSKLWETKKIKSKKND